ncbi:MAG: hypothetical protein K2J66_10200, partial [Muribaculaceae bacterium]|nr:hypothetical protein [Muribaculaceae bacterium]
GSRGEWIVEMMSPWAVAGAGASRPRSYLFRGKISYNQRHATLPDDIPGARRPRPGYRPR